MSISSTMLVSLLTVLVAVGSGRTYFRFRLRSISRLEGDWDRFSSASRQALEMNPKSHVLVDLVGDMAWMVNARHGSWMLVLVILRRGWLLNPLNTHQTRRGASTPVFSKLESELFFTIFFSSFDVLKRREIIPGLIIRLWLRRFKRALEEGCVSRKHAAVPVQMHEIGVAIHRGFSAAA